MQLKTINDWDDLINRLKISNLKNTIIFLNGELGAGKTTFAKRFLKAIGVFETVVSPTFTIINSYYIEEKDLNINHIDAYRLDTQTEENEMIEELLENSLSIIEWGEKLHLDTKDYNIINIDIKVIDETTREVNIW